MIAYLDASALVKLAVEEAQTGALRAALRRYDVHISSELVVVELIRATARAVGPAGVLRAEVVLAELALIRVDRTVLDGASRLEPPLLRSLDAIHVASAMSLGPTVELVAYDHRLVAAAAANGLVTSSPES